MEGVIKTNTYLSFAIGSEIFALEITHVLEVIFVEEITPIPNPPKHIMGVINFRGQIIPVYDMRSKVNVPEEALRALDVFIIVEVELNNTPQQMAIIGSKVYDVFETSETSIVPVTNNYKSYDTQILLGMTKANNRFIMILNPNKIIRSEELADRNYKRIEL